MFLGTDTVGAGGGSDLASHNTWLNLVRILVYYEVAAMSIALLFVVHLTPDVSEAPTGRLLASGSIAYDQHGLQAH